MENLHLFGDFLSGPFINRKRSRLRIENVLRINPVADGAEQIAERNIGADEK